MAAPTPLPTPTPLEPVTLRVLTFDTSPIKQVLQIAIKAFNASHPEVTVTIVPIDNDPAQQVASLVSAGNAPDVIWAIDSIAPSLINAGLLLDLNELANIDASFKRDDINPAALAIGAAAPGSASSGTGMYLMPAALENVQMFYNKALFKQAGVDFAAASATWDDLISACQVLQGKLREVKCLGYSNSVLPDPSWWVYLVPWIRGYGGDVLSKDGKLSTLSTPESLAGIKAYTNLWLKSQVATPPGRPDDCFIVQRCAVAFGVVGSVNQFQDAIKGGFDWDTQLMPAYPKGRFVGTGAYGFGISKGSKHPEVAWELVKLFASPEVQGEIVKSRAGMPVLKSLLNDPALVGGTPSWQPFVKGSEYGIPPRAYPPACGNFYSGLVQTALREALIQTLSTGKAEDAFKQADARIQACLDSAK
jgi:multiple sugar transport system substrate-binding protein